MPRPETAQPFAVSDMELSDIEHFAQKNELMNIALLCGELRTLRREYIHLSAVVGRQRAALGVVGMDSPPQKRYARELDEIVAGDANAPPKS
jgi:hypothetical protein